MSDATRRAADPEQDVAISRELLAQMDDAATSREYWKILITAGMGVFTDAYDLFIITEPGAASQAALGVAVSRGVRPPSA